MTWCIPPKEDAAFVCQMEQVLEVYKRPYAPKRPVVCMDEQPKQLIAETRRPLPITPGKPPRIDHEYVREGVCCVWMFVEPLGGWRDVPVTPTKKSVDWAEQVKRLVDQPRYQNAERITLVCDNLSTHKLASLYAAFEPAEALRLANRLEIVPTPGRHAGAAAGEAGLVRADAGYTSRDLLGLLKACGIEAEIPQRGQATPAGLGKERWPVERAIAWLKQYRAIGVRRDRKLVNHQALL